MANVDARGSAVSQPCSGDEFDNHVPVVEAERLASSLALHRVEDRRTGRYAHEIIAVTDERGGGNNDHQVAATDSHDSPFLHRCLWSKDGVSSLVQVRSGARGGGNEVVQTF